MKKYFYERYHSIISAKLITNQQTGRSKGYGFIEFTNYKEFQTAISQKDPIIFGKQKLVFNSAKNKYDDDEEKNSINNSIHNQNIINNQLNNNLNEVKLKSNSTDSFNENESCDTTISNAIISRDSNWSNNSNNPNIIFSRVDSSNSNNKSTKNKNSNCFLEENKTPDLRKIFKEEDSQDLLTLQIKYALKKMEKEYYFNNVNGNNNNEHNHYNYCEYFFNNSNKIWEKDDEKPNNKTIYNCNRNIDYYNKFSMMNIKENLKK